MTDDHEYNKLPRLYIKGQIDKDNPIRLEKDHAHYLGTVLRRRNGDNIRIFNGIDGEWITDFDQISKSDAYLRPVKQIKGQPKNKRRTHLLFSPIKKTRLEWLIEKSVELGVTDIHPVRTQNTNSPKLKSDRIEKQIIEAAEQSERFVIPRLHKTEDIKTKLSAWSINAPLFFCLERSTNAKPLSNIETAKDDVAILIGPEGGFTSKEIDFIKGLEITREVSLGPHILRTETAVCAALAHFIYNE